MKSDMRVVHVITGLSMGGAERALFNVLSGGLARKYGGAVLSLQGEGVYGPRIRALGVPVYSLGMRKGLPSPLSIERLRRLVSQLRPDVIQGWMYHGNLAASLAARFAPGRPMVAWNIRHSLDALSAEKWLTQWVIRWNRWGSEGVDAILYNSRLSRQQHEAFGFSALNGRVIPNGFDTERLFPEPDRGLISRRDLRIPYDATVIGHVARFHPMKDHVSFLRAAIQVMRQRSDVVCLLAGRNVNLRNPVLAGIVPPELEERFRFVGERDDVPDLMRAMDVFCQSSWSEAFPNVLGEAMALGVPCVATDVGDSRDIVGETGVIVPPSDIHSLANGLMTMLDRTREQRVALGGEARGRIEVNYGLPSVVDQYGKLYERLRQGS
ncbi:glycosyltransferase [Guyparkeria sp. GHLCS8-2]|uniref:glycosyltransferase n=1 Tax=Guyparkeria halopsychrophila TaxID=3139421 RepID=UPI0037C8B499